MNIIPITIQGEHADAIADGKALVLAVLVYYPDQQHLVTVGMDYRTAEETKAVLAQFVAWNKPEL